MPLWPFLTLYCTATAPEQYQMVVRSWFFFFFSFCFFFCFQTRLVRPGKILVTRIHAERVGYAARGPLDMFAIALMDLPESAATSIAPNLRVWKIGTVPLGDTWGPEMSTMSCNVIRWIRWSWKRHGLIKMPPPHHRISSTLLEPHGECWTSH